jgi:hypothetical protein
MRGNSPANKKETQMANLDKLKTVDMRPVRMRAVAIKFLMGGMVGLSTVLPVIDIVKFSSDEIITRRDYELDGEEPGNRTVSPGHVKKIREGLRKYAHKLLLGTFIFAVDPTKIDIKTISSVANGEALMEMVEFLLRSGGSVFMIDAQHRNQALRELWDETLQLVASGDLSAEEVVALLRQSSVPVLMVLEADRDEISRMFVTLASTKAISPSLITVMNRASVPNRLAIEVARRARLFADVEGRKSAAGMAYQTSTATGDTLYSAAALRGAASTVMIGFKDRTPELREANLTAELNEIDAAAGEAAYTEAAFTAVVDEVVELFDYAFDRMPGWRELRRQGQEPNGHLSQKDLRVKFVHGTAAGLYVIAGVIAAARFADLDPEAVIDRMARLEWQKQALTETEGGSFEHPMFEGTLVQSQALVDDEGAIIRWEARTGGGNRTAYEKATLQVLERIAGAEPPMAELVSPAVLSRLGLSAGHRGRPKLAVT